MLEAIYAWRRNGGMRWPRYERSDAIMDLRAASRTSNSFNAGPSLSSPAAHNRAQFWIVDSTGYSAHDRYTPVRRVTPPPKPGSQFTPS